MRQTLSLLLALAILIHSASAGSDTASVTRQIVAMPLGASIELRLKNKQKLRGSRGAVSNSGFTFLDASAPEQQIAFDDIASVKQLGASHIRRNVLIGVGIAAAAAVILVVAYALALGKLGHTTSIKNSPWVKPQSCAAA